MKPSPIGVGQFLLAKVALLPILASVALAQDTSDANPAPAPAPTQTNAAPQPPANPPAQSTNNPPPPAQTTQNNPPPPAQTSTNNPPPPAQTTNPPNNPPSTSQAPLAGLPTPGTPRDPPPAATQSLSGLPTLSNYVSYSYPAPTVPPTVNAPFMQRSTMPDGTVFIAVGAILGFFGLAVLVWRGIVAYLLHRSVERAAMAQHHANDKTTFPAPPAPFYKYNDRDSSPSLAGTPAGRGQRRTTRGPIPSATPSQTNLFFSPTAAGSSGMNGNRDSRFLPSGFYAAGSTPFPAFGQGQAVSLQNLRPDSRGGYSRNTMREPSPDGSPRLAARRDFSASSLSLNRPPSARAPSAYLDDLLDDNSQPLPPAGPKHTHTFSHGSGRY